ncbi:MAG TPA: MFS transporter [Chloroflexota bacterium]|jgi:MFS family permease
MTLRAHIAYLGVAFGVGAFSAFNNFTLSLWLAAMTSSYLLIGLLSNTRSFEGALVSPLFGAWSDRTWAGWLGRRRPFILVGGLLSALLLALTPAISRLPAPVLGWLPSDVGRLAPAIAAIFLFTFAFNTMDDVHKALLADLTEGAARNRLAALRVVVEMAGQVGILVLGFLLWRDGVGDDAFVVAGGLMAVGVVVTVWGVREPAPAVWEAERGAEAAAESSLSPRRILALYPGAVMFCLVMFAYWSGVNAVLPLVSIYIVDILHGSVGEAQLLPALLLLSTTALAIPVGYLGTRYGKRRMMAAGFVVMGLAGLAGLVITTVGQGVALFLLAGVGNAAILVLTIPLMADLVPRHHMGGATGLLAASGSVAAPLASLLGGSLSDLYGPRAIFAMMTVSTCAAMVLMLAVRLPRPAVPAHTPTAPRGPTAAEAPAGGG